MRKVLLLSVKVKLIIFLFFILCFSSYGQKGIDISGFGEFTFESTFGDPANIEKAEEYEEFGLIDEFSEPRNDILFPGMALVLSSELAEDKLCFLSEINFRTDHRDINLGMERCYLRYMVSNQFNVTAGIYSTPIGSLNTHQRNHGYLNTSVRPRDMVNLGLGLIPTRVLGLKFDGAFQSNKGLALKYIFSVSSGRDILPVSSPFEVDLFEEQESSLSFSGGIEFLIPFGDNELSVGLSGFIVPEFSAIYLDSLGKELDYVDLDELLEGEEEGEVGEEELDAEVVQYKEYGFAPYIKFSNTKINFIAELHSTVMTGEEGPVQDIEYNYTGFSTELAYKSKLKGKQFTPYIRYDYIDLPESGGPFLGLHKRGSEIKRFYLAGSNSLMLGVNWSVFSFNRLKFEYNYVFDGPQPMHAFLIQSAFVF